MNQRDKVNNNSKMGKRSKFRKNKVFLIILALLVVFLLVATTLAYYNGFFDNNDTNNVLVINDTNNFLNSSNVSLVTPKEGYSLITLAGLKFFVKDKYAKKYNNGEYFNSFPGGKDYYSTLNSEDDFDRSFINSSSIYYMDGHKIFSVHISYAREIDVGSYFAFNDINSKSIEFEEIVVEGHKVTIVHTDKNYSSQNIVGESTSAIFNLNGKNINIIWEGYSFDMYVLKSFFKLN
ncbi:MAG: hypothetical protein ACRCVG_06265 [Methanobacteriaceae archaeon]